MPCTGINKTCYPGVRVNKTAKIKSFKVYSSNSATANFEGFLNSEIALDAKKSAAMQEREPYYESAVLLIGYLSGKIILILLWTQFGDCRETAAMRGNKRRGMIFIEK
ncbi:hypothetical protein V3C10_17565 [[Clostridium] symbiosum]|uniref:hypothetical protein n=1 Tax=Clostridium symbiosum TaxID=1512 RepID=UPI001D060F40|nr:hypothetical protein [[Clostridium] symbiosum]MCB6608092.1 hypothetical protein [[Clostridium] symbiosum]MCB6931068.1 hypothetical protein [[Clostridium] symbiosum]